MQIGIFGKTNSGKSSLLNALTNQEFSIVSEQAGTTADPVNKAMEIIGIGPVLFIDTAGFEDQTALGEKRLEKTADALNRTDIVLAVFSGKGQGLEDAPWFGKIEATKKPVIPVLTKIDTMSQEEIQDAAKQIEELTKAKPVCVSAKTKQGIDTLIEKIKEASGKVGGDAMLIGNLCSQGDLVLLVMPQDIQAPKGRLILPQVQVMRELLDKKCVVASCTADMVEQTLATLVKPPKLIIIDSQVFALVSKLKPAQSMLTSFSVLMAATKGDISAFKDGAAVIPNLKPTSRVLIAEACTHVPQDEDIGRIKIPRMLEKIAPGIKIDFVRGTDFPASLADAEGLPLYDLIIHCGSCMFNRAYVLHRQELAAAAHIPMTNYGIAIAKITGILDDVVLP